MKGGTMAGNCEDGMSWFSGVGAVVGAALTGMVLMLGCASEAIPSTSVSAHASPKIALVGPLNPQDVLTPNGQTRMRELETAFSRPMAPGVEVTPIRPRDAGLVKVKQNGEVPLGVIAPAGTSVIFRTADGGKFVGGSIIVEVKADQAGTATAVFRATEDARGFVDVVAMSPQMSGSATFTVEIER
ncbi:MAG: hypothetical protein SFV15_11690 [Polyangiaceae bacterium]|nr:hypothetical protein [Polyangiaceae bacterium]